MDLQFTAPMVVSRKFERVSGKFHMLEVPGGMSRLKFC